MGAKLVSEHKKSRREANMRLSVSGIASDNDESGGPTVQGLLVDQC